MREESGDLEGVETEKEGENRREEERTAGNTWEQRREGMEGRRGEKKREKERRGRGGGGVGVSSRPLSMLPLLHPAGPWWVAGSDDD